MYDICLPTSRLHYYRAQLSTVDNECYYISLHPYFCFRCRDLWLLGISMANLSPLSCILQGKVKSDRIPRHA